MVQFHGRARKFAVSTALVGAMIMTPVTANAQLGDQTLHKGMQNDDVEDLQELLDQTGHFGYHEATGYFGPITEKGVKQFQNENELAADGIVGVNTFTALDDVDDAPDILLKTGNRGEAVEDLQQQLNQRGYYTYNIDSIFGPITKQAVKDFQTDHDLQVDGIAGPRTNQALKASDGSGETDVEEQSNAKSNKNEAKQESQSKNNADKFTKNNADNSKNKSADADTNDAQTMTVDSTAYTADCEGCSGVTSTGVDLKENPDKKVIAVDPEVIPLGSKVWVEGYGEATAADTGGAINGNKIDIFFSDQGKANQWGEKEVQVKVLD